MQGAINRRNFFAMTAAVASGMGLGLKRACAAATSTAQARAAEADGLISRRVQGGEVAAAAFLLRQGDFEFARAYGQAKIDTPFLIASPTKPMTASAVMWLRERGQLDLADPVGKYLPQFNGEGRDAVT